MISIEKLKKDAEEKKNIRKNVLKKYLKCV